MDEKNKAQKILEITDPNKVMVHCSKHNYFGPSKDNPDMKPKIGCSRCWFVFYLHDMIAVPPSERKERLDGLEEVLRKLAEQVERGNGDKFNVNRHPEIKYGDS